MKTGLYLGEVPIGKVIVAVAGENGIKLQEKTVIPRKGEPIEVIPDNGTDGLSKVTVEPIPDIYIDTTTNNAPHAENMLEGTIAFANTNKIEGTMPNQGAISETIDGINTETYVIPSGYHNGSGTVSLTNDIQNEVTTQEIIIAEISAILDAKASAYPTITYNASTQTLSITEVGG